MSELHIRVENNCDQVTVRYPFFGIVRCFLLVGLLSASCQSNPEYIGTADTFRDCASCPEMALVPAGSFLMGSENGQDDEKPVHDVAIDYQFALGKFEITLGEWRQCVTMFGCRDIAHGADNRKPVNNISWIDAQQYVTWLSRHTGRSYRLPSESEWEYAARAGTTTERYWGEKVGYNNAHCSGCGSPWDIESPASVGEFKPNGFGLYDMLGNVQEWVEDCYHRSYVDAPRDGRAWVSDDCSGRVLRGGHYWGGSGGYWPRTFFIRAAYRAALPPDNRLYTNGLRVAASIE